MKAYVLLPSRKRPAGSSQAEGANTPSPRKRARVTVEMPAKPQPISPLPGPSTSSHAKTKPAQVFVEIRAKKPRPSISPDTLPSESNATLYTLREPLLAPRLNLLLALVTLKIEDLFGDESGIVETSDLRVAGETFPSDDDESDDDSSQSSTDTDKDVPVRRLNRWTLYRKEACGRISMIPFDEAALLSAAGKLLDDVIASGFVCPHVDEEEDTSSESSSDDSETSSMPAYQLIHLSKVSGINWHHFDAAPRDPNVFRPIESKRLDPHIYLETQHGWYILDEPLAAYKPHFESFFLLHRMTHVAAVFALDEPRGSFEQFTQMLESDDVVQEDKFNVTPVLGRVLEPADFSSELNLTSLRASLEGFPNAAPIRNTRLYRHFFSDCRPRYSDMDHEYTSGPSSSVSRRRMPRSKSSRNPEKKVLKNRGTTCVMPIVQNIGALVFRTKQRLISKEMNSDEDVLEGFARRRPSRYLQNNPQSMVWGPSLGIPNYFSSITLDGEEYNVGDIVMLANNQEQAEDSFYTTNDCGRYNWFSKIEYFFEDSRGKKYFHGQWLLHSSKTILQEMSHPNELFFLKTCDNNEVQTILRRCDTKHLRHGEDEPKEEVLKDHQYFHRNLTYDERDASFVELSDKLIEDALSACEDSLKICVSCGLHALDKKTATPRKAGSGFIYEGSHYHIHDFVYVYHPAGGDRPLRLAQITKISWSDDKPDLRIRYLFRHADVLRRELRSSNPPAEWEFEERRVFLSKVMDDLGFVSLAGKFFIVHEDDAEDDWLEHSDHFILSHEARSAGSTESRRELRPLQREDIRACSSCRDAHCEMLEQQKGNLERFGRQRGLELFSGAGGLLEGFRLANSVDTRWAVEFSPSCALTHRQNHPDVVVYNQDSNLLLQHAVDTYGPSAKELPRPLLSICDKTPMPSMPMPGDVDFIYGGPPCQSFSRANHHKDPDDIRTTLPGNFLSFGEFYRPNFILMENVVGLLHHKLYAQDDDEKKEISLTDDGEDGDECSGSQDVVRKNSESSVIKMGMVKFVMRCLIALGYQVHMKIVQAAHYGSPQQRSRVIFWGALRGIPLPPFPIPTHYYRKPVHATELVTRERMMGVTRASGHYFTEVMREKAGQRSLGAAPHYTVRIEDAIGDLPEFHWKNPHELKPPTSDQKRKQKELLDANVLIGDAVSNAGPGRFVGFRKATGYAGPPRTDYQRSMRREISDGGKVEYHYTGTFSSGVVERTVNIPLEADANWKDLPPGIDPRITSKKNASPGVLHRLSFEASFKTSMTTLHPMSKGAFALHPNQHRTYSVRECARAQGFPDHWILGSINEEPRLVIADQMRQIGNAVPVPLGHALGRGLADALFQWHKEREAPRDGSPEA